MAMKICVLICALLMAMGVNAQEHSLATKVKYIALSDGGISDAVIVDEAALAHTTQFLPLTNKGGIVYKGDLSKQIDQIFLNMAQALKPARSEIRNIIKLNIFLKNAEQMAQAKELISKKFITGRIPAITFAPGDLSHPEALISIDAIALSDYDGAKQVQFHGTGGRPGMANVAILPKGPIVYVSGQAAKGEIAEAARLTLRQLAETLISLGLSKKDIVQIKSFITPMSSVHIVEKELSEFFEELTIPPLVYVDWVSSDPVIEIELIAASPVKGIKDQQIEYITPPGMTSSPVYSKVSRLNYGKKIYLSGLYDVSTADTDSQVNSIFRSMGTVLKASGTDFKSLLKATYYISNDQQSKSLADLRLTYYDPKRPPAASKAMLKGGTGVSIDMIGSVQE
jgi:enamine deaminase RidA (YjgF/YER057c/UK114 family)